MGNILLTKNYYWKNELPYQYNTFIRKHCLVKLLKSNINNTSRDQSCQILLNKISDERPETISNVTFHLLLTKTNFKKSM